MRRTRRPLAALGLALAAAASARDVGAQTVTVQRLALPSGETVVVSEGELEARSIGSLAVRVYARPTTPGDSTTFFVAGTIVPRDGTLERVTTADITGDHYPEIIVLTRSAGSGGYRAAYAFAFLKGTVVPRGSVTGVPPRDDAIAVLRKSLGRRAR